MAELREYDPAWRDEIVELSLRAWAPVFASIEARMDSEVYVELHPDWREDQRSTVLSALDADDVRVVVAVEGSRAVGFVAAKTHAGNVLGEIYLIAVDPEHQRHGLGTELLENALFWLREQGMKVAMVETGGDPGHAPARSVYHSAAFRPFPVEKFFRKL